MSKPTDVVTVTMPQLNVNDERAVLVGWRVADGARVREGEPLCEVETSKSVDEIPAPASGLVRHLARVGDAVVVGQIIACIGPTVEAIAGHIGGPPPQPSSADQPAHPALSARRVEATAGAIELAERHGVDLARVPAVGRIRRVDVERFIASQGSSASASPVADRAGPPEHLPQVLERLVAREPELSEHQWSIARHLAATRNRISSAHVAMDVGMSAVQAWIEAQRTVGRMASVLPVLLYGAVAAIQAVPKLAMFRLGRSVYRYLSMDLAYTARGPDGRLYTPVVREADRRSLEELASECIRLNMGIFRGQIFAGEMVGGCLTISLLADQPVRWHVGLQNAYQSVLITAGAIRQELALSHGRPVPQPVMTLTLSYDHGLLDGWEAAAALEACKIRLETLHV